MACRAQGAAGPRKGADAPARPDRPRAPRAALGARREELRLRRARGTARARRSLRGPPPAAGAALHVRPGLGAGLQELFLHGRPCRRHEHPPRASRRHLRGHLARAAGRDRALPPAHGLGVQVGVLAWQRLQLRLQGQLHAGGRGHRKDRLQLRQVAPHRRGVARHQRVLQGRRGRSLPHLLDLRPRRGSDDGHVQHARPRAQGPRREIRATGMAWVRHHDRYEPQPAAKAGSCCESHG